MGLEVLELGVGWNLGNEAVWLPGVAAKKDKMEG